MSDNWVVQNLENALNTWNEKLAEIWQLITQSLQQFKGGAIWSVIVNIHGALQVIGIALLVLFFVVGIMKTCGSFAEVKRPVKTTTDPDEPQEVASMDDAKKATLKDIFWQMNEISSRTESSTETVIDETDDGNGNIVETSTTVTRTTLYITVSHKTAEEMATQYAFSVEQRQQLTELLASENNSLWPAVLYGISVGDGEIVSVALSTSSKVIPAIAADSANILLDIMRFLGTVFRRIKISRFCG